MEKLSLDERVTSRQTKSRSPNKTGDVHRRELKGSGSDAKCDDNASVNAQSDVGSNVEEVQVGKSTDVGHPPMGASGSSIVVAVIDNRAPQQEGATSADGDVDAETLVREILFADVLPAVEMHISDAAVTGQQRTRVPGVDDHQTEQDGHTSNTCSRPTEQKLMATGSALKAGLANENRSGSEPSGAAARLARLLDRRDALAGEAGSPLGGDVDPRRTARHPQRTTPMRAHQRAAKMIPAEPLPSARPVTVADTRRPSTRSAGPPPLEAVGNRLSQWHTPATRDFLDAITAMMSTRPEPSTEMAAYEKKVEKFLRIGPSKEKTADEVHFKDCHIEV